MLAELASQNPIGLLLCGIGAISGIVLLLLLLWSTQKSPSEKGQGRNGPDSSKGKKAAAHRARIEATVQARKEAKSIKKTNEDEAGAKQPPACQQEPEEATHEQEEPSAPDEDEETSERVAKLMAKKAERKAKKAQEAAATDPNEIQREEVLEAPAHVEEEEASQQFEKPKGKKGKKQHQTEPEAKQPELKQPEEQAQVAEPEEPSATEVEEDERTKKILEKKAARKAKKAHEVSHSEPVVVEPEVQKVDKASKEKKIETIEKFEKVEKVEKDEKAERHEKAQKAEKVEKAETFEKVEKAEKVEKVEKVEKPEKHEKAHKAEKVEKAETVQKVEKAEVDEAPIEAKPVVEPAAAPKGFYVERTGKKTKKPKGKGVPQADEDTPGGADDVAANAVDQDGFECASTTKTDKAARAQRTVEEEAHQNEEEEKAREAERQHRRAQSQKQAELQMEAQQKHAEKMAELEKVNPLPQQKAATLARQGPQLSPIEKDILKMEKKLREVEHLKQRLEQGEDLEPLQREKVARFGDGEIAERIAELRVKREEEIAEEAARQEKQQERRAAAEQKAAESAAANPGKGNAKGNAKGDRRQARSQGPHDNDRSSSKGARKGGNGGFKGDGAKGDGAKGGGFKGHFAGFSKGKGKGGGSEDEWLRRQQDQWHNGGAQHRSGSAPIAQPDFWMEPLEGIPPRMIPNIDPSMMQCQPQGPENAEYAEYQEYLQFSQGKVDAGIAEVGAEASYRGMEPEPEFDPTGMDPQALAQMNPELTMCMPMEEPWDACWDLSRMGWCPRGNMCKWNHGQLSYMGGEGQWAPEGFEEGQFPEGLKMEGFEPATCGNGFGDNEFPEGSEDAGCPEGEDAQVLET